MELIFEDYLHFGHSLVIQLKVQAFVDKLFDEACTFY